VGHQGSFKKPTIKDTNRAYVRLFEFFSSPHEWLEFLQRHHVEYVAFGMQRNGDCAIRVMDSSTGQPALLGLKVPNKIKYHSYVAAARSFWTEDFSDGTHRRHRIIEVGNATPLEDSVIPL
jgi:hypothetical protein